jgi:hypothetical protein
MSEDPPPTLPRHALVAALLCVAATYVYFLIFAEFALIELAKPLAEGRLRWLMGTLAVGGVTGSFLAARSFRFERYARAVGTGFRACGAAAAFVLLAKSWLMMILAALCVGLGLGWLTVTLVSGLRGVLGGKRLGLWAGVSTGSAYAVCNLPWVFEASPATQTIFAALVAVAGAIAAIWLDLTAPPRSDTRDYEPAVTWFWVAALLALVWLDSAAFYIIQHTEPLRVATWAGAWTLGGNALTHLVAAVAAGLLIDRKGAPVVVVLALAVLGTACSWLGDGENHALGVEVLYTAGVSLYSTALITYPAHGGRPWLSARVYALAGWIGSGLGIGLAQDLHAVPLWFIALAGVLVLGALAARWSWLRRAVTKAAVGLIALGGLGLGADSPLFAAERADPVVALGRRVYVAEGCIHCHSQYVRPQVGVDVERWGPHRPLAESLLERPPLFGNRRQGPDLTQVGNRRTTEWNRLHLMHPQRFSPGSRMPAYDHLFRSGDPRGDALVAYLASLGSSTLGERLQQAAQWRPAATPMPPNADHVLRRGRLQYARLCAPCHGVAGHGDGPAAAGLSQRPPDFRQPTWRHLPDGLSTEARETVLARIIKFGVPGTVMAGHEYLDDATVVALARAVDALYITRRSSP